MKFKTEISAGGIVFKQVKNLKLKNKNYLWLITQHSQNKSWGFPKGLIGDTNSEEKMEEAALREVEEEGGVKAKIVNQQPFQVKYKYKFQDTLVDKTVFYFLMEYISGDPSNHDWEMMDAKFASEEDVKKTLTHQAELEAFEKFSNLLKKKE